MSRADPRCDSLQNLRSLATAAHEHRLLSRQLPPKDCLYRSVGSATGDRVEPSRQTLKCAVDFPRRITVQ
jgi:hypothetical protein